ncbi:TIR domain-containing protein [Glycomyces artemisiae]|uniref:TIR domain-containing protein n=1 Tax=Glycomyces artemisiae TaxID=1076443 RepID=A0A2T0UFH1_9ACTN|nr:TIR domain-containing protein [Glycomyces artemisiae]PRY56691.1 TIR domain-containing protein [Glycomyces artemisiae]
MDQKFDYDIAVSFAGEDRQFVQEVVAQVKDAGYKVFYDQDEEVSLWGEELTEYFPKIYEERSRFAVVFVSRHYAAKPWTRLERRSVLVRALDQPTPYMLPVQLDRTTLPGVRPTISYLDGERLGVNGIANAIRQKLSDSPASGSGQFNGYVPRNEHEAATLVGERPDGWEFLLYSYSLVKGIESLHGKYLDYSMGYSKPTEFIEISEVGRILDHEAAIVLSTTENFENVLSNRIQQSAFGAPGEPGDVHQIIHMADRYVSVYEQFMDWAWRLRSYATRSNEARDALRALAFYADQPIDRLRSFVYEFREIADTMHSRLIAGESIHLTLSIKLEISPESTARFDSAMRRLRRSIR